MTGDRTCEWPTCDRPKREGRNGPYCNGHYLRSRQGRDMDAPFRSVRLKAQIPDQCEHLGCTRPYSASGLCQFHYYRKYRGQPLDAPKRMARRPYVTEDLTRQGYVRVWAPDHPSARGQWVMKHRLVMEQQLGRFLMPGETVHHKNGRRDDNRPDNLELWVTFQPAGQRPADLVAYAQEIFRRYG